MSDLAVVTVDWDTVDDLDALVAGYVSGWQAVQRVACICKAWPRRLGAEATGHELATDKKMANKVAWLAQRAANLWLPGSGSAVDDEHPDWAPEERAVAAVVDWFEWLPAQAHTALDDVGRLPGWAEERKLAIGIRRRYIGCWETLRALQGVLTVAARRHPLPGCEEAANAIERAIVARGRL